LQRIGLGVSDIKKSVKLLTARGVIFVETENVKITDRGALTSTCLGSVSFELVHNGKS
jgi:4-hydroxyphenylpyruvate dioxygenase